MILFEKTQSPAKVAAAPQPRKLSRHELKVARKANEAAWDYSYAVGSLPESHPFVEELREVMLKWKDRADRLGV